jgi:hypothetical protein
MSSNGTKQSAVISNGRIYNAVFVVL